jgi:hypothetical protein
VLSILRASDLCVPTNIYLEGLYDVLRYAMISYYTELDLFPIPVIVDSVLGDIIYYYPDIQHLTDSFRDFNRKYK